MRRTARVALAAVMILAGCAPAPAASLIRVARPVTLADSGWRLVEIGGQPAPAGSDARLVFDRAQVDGNGPCNSLSAGYAYDPGTGAVRMSNLVTTKRACADATLGAAENAFLAGLRGASAAGVDERGRLVLGGAGPELVLEVMGRPGPALSEDPGPS